MAYIEVMGKAEESSVTSQREKTGREEEQGQSQMALCSERDKHEHKTLSTLIKKQQFEAVFKRTTHQLLVKGAQKAKINI